MKSDFLGDVDVGNPIAIGEAKVPLVPDVWQYALEASTGHGGIPGIDYGHLPGLGMPLPNVHGVVFHVEGNIRRVQEVVGEVLLDDIAPVTAADDELVHAVSGIDLHDVPENRLSADFDHRLWFEISLLGNPRPEATG